jgi:hypothetical protein
MARNGSLTPSDVARGRSPRYARRARREVVAEHRDAKLTDLLATLADCPKARSFSVSDRCKAVYERLHCGKD